MGFHSQNLSRNTVDIVTIDIVTIGPVKGACSIFAKSWFRLCNRTLTYLAFL